MFEAYVEKRQRSIYNLVGWYYDSYKTKKYIKKLKSYIYYQL